ncbi:MAG: response regulator transcription factor [Candidatus Ozemobacteraceae bacterium]
MTCILIVEDEAPMRELIRDNLQYEGFSTLEAGTLLQAGKEVEKQPDLIILDVNLPDGDGISTLARWRAQGIKIPVLICTVKDREIDVVRALDSGADDYVTKPFRIREFIARLKAVLRRGSHPPENGINVGDCHFDFKARTATQKGISLNLTATEWSLLELFHRNRNCVISREQIISSIWGVKDLEDSRAVDVHIGRLRKKLGDADPPNLLQTVRGLGYKLV